VLADKRVRSGRADEERTSMSVEERKGEEEKKTK